MSPEFFNSSVWRYIPDGVKNKYFRIEIYSHVVINESDKMQLALYLLPQNSEAAFHASLFTSITNWNGFFSWIWKLPFFTTCTTINCAWILKLQFASCYITINGTYFVLLIFLRQFPPPLPFQSRLRVKTVLNARRSNKQSAWNVKFGEHGSTSEIKIINRSSSAPKSCEIVAVSHFAR